MKIMLYYIRTSIGHTCINAACSKIAAFKQLLQINPKMRQLPALGVLSMAMVLILVASLQDGAEAVLGAAC